MRVFHLAVPLQIEVLGFHSSSSPSMHEFVTKRNDFFESKTIPTASLMMWPVNLYKHPEIADECFLDERKFQPHYLTFLSTYDQATRLEWCWTVLDSLDLILPQTTVYNKYSVRNQFDHCRLPHATRLYYWHIWRIIITIGCPPINAFLLQELEKGIDSIVLVMFVLMLKRIFDNIHFHHKSVKTDFRLLFSQTPTNMSCFRKLKNNNKV